MNAYDSAAWKRCNSRSATSNAITYEPFSPHSTGKQDSSIASCATCTSDTRQKYANNQNTKPKRHMHIIPHRRHAYHNITYHIISYHIISYHIISYHIISYHIISVAAYTLGAPQNYMCAARTKEQYFHAHE